MTAMQHCDPRFATLLEGFSAVELESHASTIFGLWPDLALAYCNPGWFRFAAENGGEPGISTRWPLGACVADAISEPLREYYVRRFRRCFEDGQPWEQRYECSSPGVFRLLHLTAYPIGKKSGLLVVNSTVVERPHDPQQRPAREAVEAVYVDQNG